MTEPAELVVRRVHQAPAALLFACMTTPEHLVHFWGPTGTTAPLDRIVVDLRPGGAFVTVMVDEQRGTEHTMRAVYEEVEPPTRLVWREVGSGMTTTVTFTDLGDGTTEVVTRQTDVPAPYRSPEARAGWATALDRFQEYVVGLASPGAEQEQP